MRMLWLEVVEEHHDGSLPVECTGTWKNEEIQRFKHRLFHRNTNIHIYIIIMDTQGKTCFSMAI